MKNLIIFLLPFFLFQHFISAQTASLQVTLEEEQSPNALQRTGDFKPTSDGGYIYVGTWGDYIYSRAMVIKMNANFETQWTYRLDFYVKDNFGNNHWKNSHGADIIELPDGSFTLLAAANMYVWNNETAFENFDYAIINFMPANENVDAVVNYTKHFGAANADIPQSIKSTADGGYIISGASSPQQNVNLPSSVLTYIVKLDENAEMEWDKRINKPGGACGTGALLLYNQGMLQRDVTETQDGGFIFTLACDQYNYIGKLDMDGNYLWGKNFESGGGFLEGAADDNWAILFGGGGYGTVAKIKELPNSDLAFLGNQTYFMFSIFGIDVEGDGGGLGLPFSYLFITDAEGNFKNGTGFFRRTFNQPDMPIQMLAEDFTLMDNGNFMIACGIDKYVNGGLHSYTPALLELDPSAEEFNEAMISMSKIKKLNEEDSHHRLNVRDYPWGLDAISLDKNEDNESIHLSYDNHLLFVNDIKSLPNLENCFEQVSNTILYSFPFELNFNTATFSMHELSEMDFLENSVSMTTKNVGAIEECAEDVINSTQTINNKPIAKAILQPNITDFGFTLQADSDWIGASVSLVNLQGKVLEQFKLEENHHYISTENLAQGLYFVFLRKDDTRLSLKGVVK